MPLDPQGGCGCKWYDVIGSRRESPNAVIPWCVCIGASTHGAAEGAVCRVTCALRATTAKHALLLRDGGRELPRVRRVRRLGRCLREGGEGAVEGEGHRECVAGGAARSGGGVS
jgi:hypothetical protein